MNPKPTTLTLKRLLFLAVATFFVVSASQAQMRNIYQNTDATSNELCKLSFYSPSQGFVAFSGWIGFSTDSGRTFTRKTIALSNVNYNGYPVNLTFGFDIMGIKSFDANNLIVYGDYGAIPAILYSVDGGNTFKVIFYSQIDPQQISLTNGVAAMDFIPGSNTGFAVDEDRILTTTDKGLTWSVSYTHLKAYYNYVQALNANNIIAGCTYYDAASILQKSTNGGANWQTLTLPAPSVAARLTQAWFINATTGWIVLTDNGAGYVYRTTDGGVSWTLLNNVHANPFPAARMKFVDNTTGYAVDGQNTVYKTTNGGAVWEPLSRDNHITYPFASTNDLQLMGSNQLWAGWAGLKMLELSTNGGGTALPKAYLAVDTAGLATTGNVQLNNYSAAGYSYRWLLNGAQTSTTYNTSYVHDPNRLKDTITLIVTNGTNSDTATAYQYFNAPLPAPTISSFSPSSGITGSAIIIYGSNFYPNGIIPVVTIGGVPAAYVYVYSNGNLGVVVGEGASGNIVVTTWGGSATTGPFTYIPHPLVDSINPAAATLGDTVTIYGRHFTGATRVSLGDTAVTSFTVISDSVIRATVWLGASGMIKVISPAGIGQTTGFTFIPPPAPTITALSTFAGTPGTPVRITGTHFYGTVSVTIAGVAVNSFTVVSDTEIDATAGFSQSGSLTVTTLFGSATIPGFVILSPPVINSFSPANGPIGTPVTITGSGFSPIVAENTVYLGPVRAIVTSATTTQLVVKVPYGAGYQPVSVTARNLTAYSQQPFIVTSPDSIRTLTDSTFTPRKDFDPGQYISSRIEIADLDGDGKADLAATTGSGGYTGSGYIGVKRNTSSPGSLSFDPEISFGTGYFPNQIAASDINGDGKLDLVASGQDIFVFKNTSGGTGNISFTPVPVVTSHVFGTLAIGDLNGDGKPDIVITNPSTNSVMVYGNVSTPDSIAFALPISFSLGAEGITASLAVGDLDADGKPEIVVTYAFSGVVVFHNTGGNGKFSFTQTGPFPIKSYFTSGASPSAVSIGDLDGDGKPDLAIALGANAAFSVMRNTSATGTISFDKELQFTAGDNFTKSISLNDMDGDGKPDVTIDDNERDHVRVYKNISTAGNIGFTKQLQYDLGDYMGPVNTGDLDGDGKADIVATSTYYSQVMSVFRNRSEVAASTAIADTNYRIQVVNNTWRGKNDGRIFVDFNLPLTYSVKISADGFTDSAHFTGKNFELDNLAAGVYQLCVTIDSLPGYSQCFTANLTQPRDLSVLSTVSTGGNSLTLLLGGSDVYIVDLNGNEFQTTDTSVVLPLQPGANLLTVQTPLACQGIVTRSFAGKPGTGEIRSVPNPVISTATLYLPGTDNQVVLEVLGADGRTIGAPRTYAVGADRTVRLDLGSCASGIYLVHIRGAQLNASIKLIKTF